jgi:hypothetical protein
MTFKKDQYYKIKTNWSSGYVYGKVISICMMPIIDFEIYLKYNEEESSYTLYDYESPMYIFIDVYRDIKDSVQLTKKEMTQELFIAKL